MDIRRTLNQNPIVISALTGVVIVVLSLFAFRSGCSRPDAAAAVPDKQFFTVDDGRTWFAADAAKVPPFQHEGKTAYRARVFRCGGTEFVSHMERYSKADKERLEGLPKSEGKPTPTGRAHMGLFSAFEVKKPGDKNWVKRGTASHAKIMQPQCPDGSRAGIQVVLPR